MIKANSLEEIEGQLTRILASGVGPWEENKEIADKEKSDMNWIPENELEKLEELMEWCRVKYYKQYDAVIIEHVEWSGISSSRQGSALWCWGAGNKTKYYRKWFDMRLSFNNPNAALEFKMVWG